MTDGSLDIMKDNSGLTGRETRSGWGKEGHEQRGFFFPTPELGVNQTGVRGGNRIRLGRDKTSLCSLFMYLSVLFSPSSKEAVWLAGYGEEKTGSSDGVAS